MIINPNIHFPDVQLKFYIMTTTEVLYQLKKEYECKYHPEDKNAIVIYNCNLDSLCRLCKKYHASGHMAQEDIAVITNFGKYY